MSHPGGVGPLRLRRVVGTGARRLPRFPSREPGDPEHRCPSSAGSPGHPYSWGRGRDEAARRDPTAVVVAASAAGDPCPETRPGVRRRRIGVGVDPSVRGPHPAPPLPELGPAARSRSAPAANLDPSGPGFLLGRGGGGGGRGGASASASASSRAAATRAAAESRCVAALWARPVGAAGGSACATRGALEVRRGGRRVEALRCRGARGTTEGDPKGSAGAWRVG